MNEKYFISQLKTLKEIRPKSTWLKANREILLSQISNSGAETLSPWRKLLIDVRSFSLLISKPVAVLASMFVFVAGTAAFSHLALSSAKPNDSLYIARIISEKAKLSTVFNLEAKDKMEAKFAAEHVEAITEALAMVDLEENNNEDKLARLNDSFNREINIVREKMISINTATKIKDVSTELNSKVELTTNLDESDDDLMQVADSNKSEEGTELFINEPAEDFVAQDTKTATNTPKLNESDKAVSDKEVAELASILDEAKDAGIMLEEVQVLYDAKDYEGAREKMREVKKMLK